MTPNFTGKDRRQWPRLQLAIPVFVRSREENGKESLEFATATNISAGGATVVVRRPLAQSSALSLEIPSAPVGRAHGLRRNARPLKAKTVWVAHLNDYHMLGVKFTRPLDTGAPGPSRRLGKGRSAL